MTVGGGHSKIDRLPKPVKIFATTRSRGDYLTMIHTGVNKFVPSLSLRAYEHELAKETHINRALRATVISSACA